MSDESSTTPAINDGELSAAPRRRRAVSRPAGPPPTPESAGGATSAVAATTDDLAPVAKNPSAKKTAAKKTAAKKTSAKKASADQPVVEQSDDDSRSAADFASATETASEPDVSAGRPAKRAAKKTSSRAAKKTTATTDLAEQQAEPAAEPVVISAPSVEAAPSRRTRRRATDAPDFSTPAADVPESPIDVAGGPATMLMFQAPSADVPATRRRATKAVAPAVPVVEVELDEEADDELDPAAAEDVEGAEQAEDEDSDSARRRRRRRGGRGRRRRGPGDFEAGDESAETRGTTESAEQDESEEGAEDTDENGEGGTAASSRRRRRRRRGGSDGADGVTDDPPNTVVRVREPRARTSEVTSLKGSTRLEAKKQRRREGREAGRRRPSILTEAEFLARREAVDRVMVVRQREDRTQIAVLEDGVLVEHYVNRNSGASMIGNVYLGRVQNVLPSMEAAFIDIGRGRNAVLYAGEVNWDATSLEGQAKRIELALKPGDPILVQVSKDPMGHKGARLTAQISLPGRFLVYVPNSSMTGISRKLPDTERSRLKAILREVVPSDGGVIVRTAAEGASEEELRNDVARLVAQWDEIAAKIESSQSTAPVLLQGEPDLAIKVVRDIFNEDFGSLVVEGGEAAESIRTYVAGIAPDLADRITSWVGPKDMFASYRIDEQLAKALDRKVWLPSGGSLVIDRTEAMTVVDVNTGKFVGQGGNLEETVTSNNIEAAEEIVRQLRLRDIGGIIVVDFIDMVLESNRDLVLRRLLECLGRDRTKHQVAEVTSLGLVQMTRKKIGQGLLEVFSEPCEACHGRGFNVHSEPVAAKPGTLDDDEPAPSGRRRKSGDDDGAVSRAKSRSRTRPIEVEPRAIDPEASLAMEKVHAAAAKAAADKAAGAFPAVVADQWASDDVASDQPVSDEPGAEGDRSSDQTADRSSDQTADQSEAPTGRGSRRRGSKKPSRPPIVVRSEPAPVIVPVINLAPASLVELDSTPSPRRRGPRKATRNAGPAAITAAQGDPAV